jgi:AcrR family transcriptional regulator
MGTQTLDARMQRSRRLLHDAMLALLEEKPFDQITVREITARAHLGYATFFRHYGSKDALLHDLAASQISALLDLVVPMIFSSGNQNGCLTMCNYVWDRRTLWSALLTGGAASTVRDEFIRQSRQVAASNAPNRSSWLPRDLVITWTTGTVVDVLAWWLSRKEKYPVEQIAAIIDTLTILPSEPASHLSGQQLPG